MKTILVTGGCGFIGSNYINYLFEQYDDKEFTVINMDKMTYAADKDNIKKEVQLNPNYIFIKNDIVNISGIEYIFEQYNIDTIVHFAAESHVDNSIASPDSFVQTNILGTFNLLEVAKKHIQHINRFHYIDTDEIFGSVKYPFKFDEQCNIQPNNPYSASKASAHHLVNTCYKTFGLPISISNCSNNYGPNQHIEKFIPTIITKAVNGQSIPIYGNGMNVRDWIYVKDHCMAIDSIVRYGENGESYNIGGDNEINNFDLCKKICEILDILVKKSSGTYKSQIEYVTDRLGHDYRYAIDHTKITNKIGWIPETSFDIGLLKTVIYYLKKLNKL
jgi:dTDP-glucose 4,6-dehydratase